MQVTLDFERYLAHYLTYGLLQCDDHVDGGVNTNHNLDPALSRYGSLQQREECSK